MKPMTASEIKQITGTSDYACQIEILREHGLNPLVDRKTGRPYIYRSVVEKSMIGTSEAPRPTINLEAFD